MATERARDRSTSIRTVRTRASVVLVLLAATMLMALSAVADWTEGTRYIAALGTLVIGIPLLLMWQDGVLKSRRDRRP